LKRKPQPSYVDLADRAKTRRAHLLVSSEEDLTERLLSYDGNKIEQQFDPKNARRTIDVVHRGRPAISRVSPLTDGQLSQIFAPRPDDAKEEFIVGVKDYLNADNRRRILLMLDEADNFIKHEASKDYRDVVKLLNLMAETDHRFKFVLAGLHNVSRIAKSENSPLAQISNDPIRIGPLLQEDVGGNHTRCQVPGTAARS
jgi:hypothetical protein